MKINVPAHEARVVRLFAIDLDARQIADFESSAVPSALGVRTLDADYIEVFHVSDLDGMGLAQYLTDGAGIPSEQVAQHHTVLSSLKGHVLLVMSAAFGGDAQTLQVKAPLRHVATLSEATTPIAFEPLPDASAKGVTAQGKPVKSDARIGGMIATYALLFLFALVGLMIWVAG